MDSLTNKTPSMIRWTAPHYFKVILEDGGTRCCGTAKDLERVLRIFPNAEVRKVYYPEPPRTVDVPHISVGKEQTLPMQQILPESDLETLNI